jgi:S-DNA-T family DNA segregation ATPase FtsK/SpoIIIE
VPAQRVAEQTLRVVTDPEPIVEVVPEETSIEIEDESADAVAEDAEAALGTHDAEVRACGLLFIDRQRVAVSMLQREFGMDFKRATEMLDELQRLGLIGPYMGGTRRDILMDRESWLAAVARI